MRLADLAKVRFVAIDTLRPGCVNSGAPSQLLELISVKPVSLDELFRGVVSDGLRRYEHAQLLFGYDAVVRLMYA